MANAELNVILSAEGRQLTSAMKKAERDVQSFNNETKKLPSSFGKLDNSLNNTSKKLNDVGNAAKASNSKMLNFSRVIQDLPFGLIGIQNNLTQLIPGVGLLGLAFTGLITALTFSQVGLSNWVRGSKGSSDAAKDATEKAKLWEEQQKALKDAFDNAAKSIINQTTKVEDLGRALIDTSNKTAVLTAQTIKQGLAQLLFTQKEGAIQKILSDRLEKQLKVEKQLLSFRESEFKAAQKTAQQGPLRLVDEQELRAAGIGLNQTEKQLFDINKLARSLGISFDQFVDDPKSKGPDKFLDNLLKKVRLAEKFINEQTIRFANFEIDPDEKRSDIIKKANEFLNNVFNNRRAFMVKTQIAIQAIDLKPTQSYFEAQRNNAAKLLADLQEEVNKLTRRNPILIQAKRTEVIEKARGAEFFQALGISSADENAPKSLLTDAQKAAVNLANVMNQTVVPAFDNLFNAIKAGENPIKAFFQGLGQAIQQLIQKLLQAVLQAALLSAITGGTTSFGSAFKSLLGFRAKGGPVIAGQPYVVGEKGPELFMPSRSGQIIPNNQMNSAGITGGLQIVRVEGRLRNRDIVLGNARESRSQNRNG